MTEKDTMLADSAVPPADMIYPADIRLIFKAFGKMRQSAEKHGIPPRRDDREIRTLWRELSLNKNKNTFSEHLSEFALSVSALRISGDRVGNLPASDSEKENARDLLTLPQLPDGQEIAGERHMRNRTVSPGEPEARPMKKGERHPDCEFGTTPQLPFSRQGFTVTAENLIGKPDDKTLRPGTSGLSVKRMGTVPESAIGGQGCRSRKNLSIPGKTEHISLGRGSDAAGEKKDFRRKARSATEGFTAVARNLRGFGRSPCRGFRGDRIRALPCQTAFSLRKFPQPYFAGETENKSLARLGPG